MEMSKKLEEAEQRPQILNHCKNAIDIDITEIKICLIHMSNRKNPGNTKYVFDGHWFMEIDGNC
jgi:hypothetical protein